VEVKGRHKIPVFLNGTQLVWDFLIFQIHTADTGISKQVLGKYFSNTRKGGEKKAQNLSFLFRE